MGVDNEVMGGREDEVRVPLGKTLCGAQRHKSRFHRTGISNNCFPLSFIESGVRFEIEEEVSSRSSSCLNPFFVLCDGRISRGIHAISAIFLFRPIQIFRVFLSTFLVSFPVFSHRNL